MDGILLIDKPAGWTSHDVVAKVRSLLRQQAKSPELKVPSKLLAKDSQLSARGSKVRVGHTGTLDPSATGLLVLVVGSYTKRAEQFSKMDKTYEAELTLGAVSSTGDREGELNIVSDLKPSIHLINDAIASFIGSYEQTPPAYSAVKVDGQRAYKAARAGKSVEIKPRKVTIYQLQTTNYQYPKLYITARVSSGTYIRSLAEDIGRKLGVGAYLSNLRRTQVGKFQIEDALDISTLPTEVRFDILKP